MSDNTNPTIIESDAVPPEPGFWKESWYQLTRNRAAMAGLVIIAIFALMAILAPILAPTDPLEQTISARMTAPFTGGYILGTDDLGRDMLSRIIYGGQISLIIGVVSVGISLALGLVLGLIAGYLGGWVDKLIMRIIDIMLAFPYILLTIVIVAILGPSLLNAMVAIGISQMPPLRPSYPGLGTGRTGTGLRFGRTLIGHGKLGTDVPNHPAQRFGAHHRPGHPGRRRGHPELRRFKLSRTRSPAADARMGFDDRVEQTVHHQRLVDRHPSRHRHTPGRPGLQPSGATELRDILDPRLRD